MPNCSHTRISTHGKCLDCSIQVYDSEHLNKKGFAGRGAIVKKVQKKGVHLIENKNRI